MIEKKLGSEPAFPQSDHSTLLDNAEGISKRLYIATILMQGLLAGNSFFIHADADRAKCADISFKFADELLKLENL